MEPFSIGDLHPILVHFPIAFLTLGLFCDLLNGVGKKTALLFAHWVIIGGAILCIPTLMTGWEAAETLPPGNPFVATHRLFAFATALVALLHAFFRFMAMRKQWELAPVVYVSCSVMTVLLLAITADYGNRITHGTSLFTWW